MTPITGIGRMKGRKTAQRWKRQPRSPSKRSTESSRAKEDQHRNREKQARVVAESRLEGRIGPRHPEVLERPRPLVLAGCLHELDHRVAEDEDDDRERGSDPDSRLGAVRVGACAAAPGRESPTTRDAHAGPRLSSRGRNRLWSPPREDRRGQDGRDNARFEHVARLEHCCSPPRDVVRKASRSARARLGQQNVVACASLRRRPRARPSRRPRGRTRARDRRPWRGA